MRAETVAARAFMAVESAQQIAREPYARWRFTVDDFQRMGEVGIVEEGDRVELIYGEVIAMNPIGAGHGGHVIRWTRILARGLGDRALISVQNPVQFRPRAQPQPDIILLRPRADDYTTSHPTAADALLIVEVSDSSLAYDRDTKAPIYAQAGIADYWILDLVNERLHVFRQLVDGAYRSLRSLDREESIAPLEFPDLSIAVSEILA